jgi:hypothetical protein
MESIGLRETLNRRARLLMLFWRRFCCFMFTCKATAASKTFPGIKKGPCPDGKRAYFFRQYSSENSITIN